MHTSQIVLIYIFDIVFYLFSTLLIFRFWLGLFALASEPKFAATQPTAPQTAFETASVLETLPEATTPEFNVDQQHPQKIEQPKEKLTFMELRADFARYGFTLQKRRCGRFRYQAFAPGSSPQKLRTLEEAFDWLTVSTRSSVEITV